MKNLWKKCLGILLTLLLIVGVAIPALAANSSLSDNVSKTAAYMLQTVQKPQVGSIGGEWAVLGLARSGYDVPQQYWDDYYAEVESYVKECSGVLHNKKYTEYSRVILALSAIGADPTDVAGYNLLTPLGDFEKTIWQGINGPIWALIALDSAGYEMPVNAAAKTQATRQMYIDEIISRQLDDGGWNLTAKGGSSAADADITGMALQALAKYQDQPKVKAATEKALLCLSDMQNDKGGYSSYSTTNLESVVQVVTALCELGIDINDPRFIQNGNTLLDNLLSYRQADGSFCHTAGGGTNQMATEQGFYGIVAAMRADRGQNTLYRMNDCTISISSDNKSVSVGLPGKDAAVRQVAVNAAGTTFTDIKAHANQAAVEALASRGIITGEAAGGAYIFRPNDTMTRAEFAAIVVRALGLETAARNVFADIKPGAWYAAYIDTANAYGIVNGTSATTFEPDSRITRQEAAAMVARAARLCGMDTDMESYEVLNTLAQFGDYVTINDWAREFVAFCYSEDILDQSDLNVEPARAILRCEIAQMLYNLLDKAELL
ncbi:MAG: S-layer homology domain-containing protein [Firmicutes bacterium]|nr:S-layer homology domain-containing protein [Bacillota bacterium]